MLKLISVLREELWSEKNSKYIGFKDLDFKFSASHHVFTNAEFTASNPGFTALLGENGRGKTTILRILAGFYQPQRGRVCPEKKNSILSFSGPEGSDLPPYSKCVSVVGGLLKNSDTARCNSILKAIDLFHHRQRHICTLSSGQKKRLSLFRALVMGKDAILLDEPFSHLDIKFRQELIKCLLKLKKSVSIVFTTHDPSVLESLDPHNDRAYWIDGYLPTGGSGTITGLSLPINIDDLLSKCR